MIDALLTARYVQRSAEGHYAANDASPSVQVDLKSESVDIPVVSSETRRTQVEAALELEQPESEHEGDPAPQDSRPTTSDRSPRVVTLSEDARGIIGQLKNNLDQTNQRLVGMQEFLKDALKDGFGNITQLMIKLHNHSARVSELLPLGATLIEYMQGIQLWKRPDVSSYCRRERGSSYG